MSQGTVVRQLPTITAVATSANSPTISVGNLDDAVSITIYMISSAAAASSGTGLGLQVCQFNPALATSAAGEVGTVVSSNFHFISSTIFSTAAGLITSSGMAITITPGAWMGLRLHGLTSATQGEKIAYISKQIYV